MEVIDFRMQLTFVMDNGGFYYQSKVKFENIDLVNSFFSRNDQNVMVLHDGGIGSHVLFHVHHAATNSDVRFCLTDRVIKITCLLTVSTSLLRWGLTGMVQKWYQ